MPLTPWDVCLPGASPPDRILRSGLPECGIRALSPVAGAREVQGRGGGDPWDSCIIWPELLPAGHSSQRAPELASLQAPPPGKGSKTEDASCRGRWTLGHTGSDAFISRGALPLLKE